MSMPLPGEARKIVVADDDVLLSEVLVTALRADGYAAVSAPGGILTEELATGAQLVILDAHIPGVDFRATLEFVRRSGTSVLVLSGEPSPPMGVTDDEFRAKPMDLDVLLSAVHRLATQTSVG